MSYSLYVNQLEDLYLLHGRFENSLEPLRFLNVDCPEMSLMLNKIEKEADEIRQRIVVFDNFLFNDILVPSLKVFGYNEQVHINKMFGRIRYDLLVSSHKIIELVYEQILNNNVSRKRF